MYVCSNLCAQLSTFLVILPYQNLTSTYQFAKRKKNQHIISPQLCIDHGLYI